VPRMREVAAGALWALARDNPELQKAIDRSGNIYAEHLPQRDPKKKPDPGPQ
ncbi:vac8, partial [Symbiodinium natans]